MPVEENKKLVRQFYEAGNRGDMETCFSIISDDIQWTNIGNTRYSGTFNGKADLMDRLLGPLFGQLKQGIAMTVQRLIGEGDLIVAHSLGAAETHDGRPYNNTYCWIIRIENGQFVEVTEFADTELIAATLS